MSESPGNQSDEPRQMQTELSVAMANIREITRLLTQEAVRLSGGRVVDMVPMVGWSLSDAANAPIRDIRADPMAWTLYSRGFMDGARSVRLSGPRRREADTTAAAAAASSVAAAATSVAAAAAAVEAAAADHTQRSQADGARDEPGQQGSERRRRRRQRRAGRPRDAEPWEPQPDEADEADVADAELAEIVGLMDGRSAAAGGVEGAYDPSSPPAVPPRPINRR